MARSEINRGEVKIADLAYKLGGDQKVQIFYASQFPAKQVIGDYSKDSDPSRSTWPFFSDQTEGIGIEDMDEARHSRRSWWSNCNVEYPGYGSLPRLASTATLTTLSTLADGGLETWASSTDLTSWVEVITAGTSSVIRNTGTKRSGTYCAQLYTNGGYSAQISQTCTSWSNDFRKRPIAVEAYINAALQSGTAECRFTLDDGASTTTVAATADSTYRQTVITKICGSAATGITLTLAAVGVPTGALTAYVDDVAFVAATAMGPACDFNGDSYFAMSNTLYRIDNSTGNLFFEGSYAAAITDLISSVGSNLYILVGDSTAYWYRNTGAGTATVFQQTDVSNADKGVHWNNKLAKISTAGVFAYASTPNAASPTWTSRATFDTGSHGTINGLITYQNSSGVDSIYVATTKGLFMYDDTNNLWLNTGLKVPTHADNGKGLIVQNGRLLYSAGLAVYEYYFSGNVAVIDSVGLDHDGGIPDEYNGSIVKLISGYEGEVFALLDASLISASNFSSVIKRTKDGYWHPVWVDGTANESLSGGLATSSYAYRLWFGVASGVNWIPLDRARRNPMKVSTATFAPSSRYISPWFDAAWAGPKNALAVRSLARGTTANEIITIRYRIDKATTDVVASTAGWTTIDTLVAADAGVESLVGFASSAGVAFRDIQTRIDMERASGTTTNRPILISSVLEYERLMTAKWGYRFSLNCSIPYSNQSPEKQQASIRAAIESQTLVTFYYGGPSEPRYVRLLPAQGEFISGDAQSGIFNLVAIEK